MDVLLSSQLMTVGVLVAVPLLVESGRRLGARRLRDDPEGARAGVAAVEGSVFALLGLLLAFSFSGAASRFDARRALEVQEVNAVGTAWLRLDALPAATQPELRDLIRRYVDERIETYARLPDDVPGAEASLARSIALQGQIWSRAVAACATPEGRAATLLVLPSLNEMFDVVTARTTALRVHTPLVIYAMLVCLVLASALLAGYSMAESRRPSRVHVLAFALVLAATLYVIRDLDYPRHGLIRVDATDRVLLDLRSSFDRSGS